MKRFAAARCTAVPPATDPVNATAVDAAVADEPLRVRMGQMQHLKDSRRQTRVREALGEALRGEGSLGGMFEQNRVARHDRRHDAVDGDQKGIVPGRDREHHAVRLAADETAQAGRLTAIDVRKGIGGGTDHVTGSLYGAAHLARRTR